MADKVPRPGRRSLTSCPQHPAFSGACRTCVDVAVASAKEYTLEELEDLLASPLVTPGTVIPFVYAPPTARAAMSRAKADRAFDDAMKLLSQQIFPVPAPSVPPPPPGRPLRSAWAAYRSTYKQMLFGGVPPTVHPLLEESPRVNVEHVGTKVGVVLGWRCWRVITFGGRKVLGSVGMTGDGWLPRVATTAVCHSASGNHRDVVDDECECGMWALRSPMHSVRAAGRYFSVAWADSYPRPPVIAIGIVALWGRIVEHGRGWRGQYGYPQALVILEAGTSGICDELEDLYRIPASWVAHPDGLMEVMRMTAVCAHPRAPYADEIADLLNRGGEGALVSEAT